MQKARHTLISAVSLSLLLAACSPTPNPNSVAGTVNPNGVTSPGTGFNNGTNLTNGTPASPDVDFNDVEPSTGASAAPNETPIVLPEPTAMPTNVPSSADAGDAAVDSSLYAKAGITDLAPLSNRLTNALASLRPSNLTYSQRDLALLSELIIASRNQMLLTRAASSQLHDGSVSALAEAEASFGMTLKAKLDELAYAAGIDTSRLFTLATQFNTANQGFDVYNPANYTSGSVAQILLGQNTAGLDAAYIARSGVNGNQELDGVLTRIENGATDPALIQLATEIHPLVRTYLRLSQSLATALRPGGKQS